MTQVFLSENNAIKTCLYHLRTPQVFYAKHVKFSKNNSAISKDPFLGLYTLVVYLPDSLSSEKTQKSSGNKITVGFFPFSPKTSNIEQTHNLPHFYGKKNTNNTSPYLSTDILRGKNFLEVKRDFLSSFFFFSQLNYWLLKKN